MKHRGGSMTLFLWQFFIALGIYLIFDVIWLSTAGPALYATELKGMLLDKPNLALALVFYLIYTLGVVVFVVRPAGGDVNNALLMGGAFGLVAYATYDMTNLASLKGFTTKIAMIDLAWGTALTASVSSLTVLVLRFFKIG
jgi:uncharacterized membrane protein